MCFLPEGETANMSVIEMKYKGEWAVGKETILNRVATLFVNNQRTTSS